MYANPLARPVLWRVQVGEATRRSIRTVHENSFSHSVTVECVHVAATDFRANACTHRHCRECRVGWQRRCVANTRIVIEGGRIVAPDPKAGPVNYDLRGLTVMPGWIDAHVHITWSFGKDGKNASFGTESPETAYAAAANAWATLRAGFTTVQSVGSPLDLPLREAIRQGVLPGPRLLTAVEALVGRGEASGTPEEIRVFIRKQKAAGADVIKIMASGGIRQGEKTLSQEQLNAACGEANKLGLRTLVHAYRDAVPAALQAGCTQIEHGIGATDEVLKSLAGKGVYFDPQTGGVILN